MHLPHAVLPILVLLGTSCSDVQTEPTKPMMWADHNGDHVRDQDPGDQELAIAASVYAAGIKPGSPKPPSGGSHSQRATRSARYRSAPSGGSLAKPSGSLPPRFVLMRESKGDIRVWNGTCYAPVGWTGKSPCGTSSASGKWQITRGTWGGYKGYVNAADAPEEVQDERASQLWNDGRGCSHWAAC